MRELIGKWRDVAVAYRSIQTPAEDICDIASAFLFTIAALLYGVALCDIFGGSHG